MSLAGLVPALRFWEVKKMTGRELMAWIEDNGAMDNDVVVFEKHGMLVMASEVELAEEDGTGRLAIVIS